MVARYRYLLIHAYHFDPVSEAIAFFYPDFLQVNDECPVGAEHPGHGAQLLFDTANRVPDQMFLNFIIPEKEKTDVISF